MAVAVAAERDAGRWLSCSIDHVDIRSAGS
jgi:hypothetical protein